MVRDIGDFMNFRGFRDFDGFKQIRFKGIRLEMNGSKDI